MLMTLQDQGDTQPNKVSKPVDQEEHFANQDNIGDTIPVPAAKKPEVEDTVQVQTEPLQTAAINRVAEPLTPLLDDSTAGKPPKGRKAARKNKPKRGLWILLGLVLVIILGGVGSWLGYQAGIQKRLGQESSQIAMAAVTQFQLALEDEAAGRFEMARKRYEYVVRLDPRFPGVQDRLTEVMLHMAETAVPTEMPTPTLIPVTPTPDTRGIEEKFNHAVSLLRSSDWDNTIMSLELIRKEDINYRAVDVDGMFYIALRFRGVQKILGGNLEPGIYDLTLSERFAPLDKEADSYRSWARYYLTGSSFWEIDWEKVVEIFGEIYPYLPNLRDGSGWTAQERFRIGAIRYGDQLALEGNWCDARYYYSLALSLAGDEKLAPTATAVQLLCEPPTPTATPTPIETMTPTPESTEDLTAICCPVLDPENPDPRCETFTCPVTP